MRKILACLVLFLLMFGIVANYVKAENIVAFPEVSGGRVNEAIAKTTHVRILPSSPFYILITAKENVNRFFQPSAARRAKFDFIITSKRLKEAYLLMDTNDYVNADKILKSYSDRIDKMLVQIKKARGQNQNIEPVLEEIADGFSSQEVLFYSISKKLADSGYSGENYNNASLSFMKAVDEIDTIRPGFKNRFRSAINYAVSKQKLIETVPTPGLQEHFETTTSASPRRIIY